MACLQAEVIQRISQSSLRPKRTKFPAETHGMGTKEKRLIGGLMADKRWDNSRLA
jgi:hypothetical protein